MPLKFLIRNLISRPSTQSAFFLLAKLCHAGMNYGGGQSVEESGETVVLESIRTSDEFILFDVGANDGGYLAAALPILGSNVRAWSFEPQSASFKALHERFAGDPRIRLVNAALGDTPGFATIYFDSDGTTTASLVCRSERSEAIAVATLDSVCNDEEVSRIDLLKIDTEGFEMEVLTGALEMISRGKVRAIQFEFGDTYLHSKWHFIDFWELLSPRYEIHRILRNGLTRIQEYSPDLEVYKLANFFCLLKQEKPRAET